MLGSQLAGGYIAVDLSNMNLGDEGAAYLAEHLAFSVDLQECDFSGNGIGAGGAASIAAALAGNTHLRSLSLRGKQLGDDGVIAIAKVLETENRALEAINLSGVGMGDAGAAAERPSRSAGPHSSSL